MHNPAVAQIPPADKIAKARDEIKRKLAEQNGVWLISPLIYDQDACHYFSLYCADKLMKGVLLTEQEFYDKAFLTAAKRYGHTYDKVILELHKQIKETATITTAYDEIHRLINVLYMLNNNSQLSEHKRAHGELCSSILKSKCEEYSKKYEHLYVFNLAELINKEDIHNINNELLAQLNFQRHETGTVDEQNEKVIVYGEQLIPAFNETTLLLIRDKSNYRYVIEDNEHKLVNVCCPDAHYISINFSMFDGQPTLFIIDANFGIIKYQNVNDFAMGLGILLTLYNKRFTNLNLMHRYVNNKNSQPKVIMKSSDWQASFCSPTKDEALPTVSLRQQISMPEWAKQIATALSDYEKTQNHWSKVEIVRSLQKLVSDKDFLKQVYSDLRNMKNVQPIFAQLNDQIKSYFMPLKELTIEDKISAVKSAENIIERKISPP